MNKTCIKDAVLDQYLDQSLSEPKLNAVQSHIDQCPSCQKRLIALKQVDAAIRDIPSIAPSSEFDAVFWQKVARIQAQPSRLARIKIFLAGWRPAWRPVMATCTAAMIVAGLLLFERAIQPPTPNEIFMAENMHLLDDFELIQSLDLFEDWEAIQEMRVEG